MNLGKQSIRPKLKLKEASTVNEKFQNEVLRPILKLQHPILIAVFVEFSEKLKTNVNQLSFEEYQVFIKRLTEKNTTFRNQLIGIVIGMLTKEEFTFYKANSSEYNKRILQMIRQRLVDSYKEVKQIVD